MSGAVASGTELAVQPAAELRHTKPAAAEMEAHPDWAVLQRLPMRLTAGVPLPRLTVRALVGLAAGQVLESTWPVATDVSLRAGAVQLSWAEFEVVEDRMAVRLTRLA